MKFNAERKVVKTYQSENNPNREYEIRTDGEGILYCNCAAWLFQKKPSHLRTCKHIFKYVGEKTNQSL